MKLAKTIWTASVVMMLGILLAPGSALAEKIDCSGSKKLKQRVSRDVIKPGDRPDRELAQFVRVDVLSSKNPEFDGVEQTVYGHTDTAGGAGSHSGYSMTTLKSGEKLWLRWQGTHYVVPKGDAWESSYQGVARFIAGTGKYKAIRGGGYYQGKQTPDGLTEEFKCEGEH
jgi:hypothetical protein